MAPRYEWAFVQTWDLTIHCTETQTLNLIVNSVRRLWPEVKVTQEDLVRQVPKLKPGQLIAFAPRPVEYDSTDGQAQEVRIKPPQEGGDLAERIALRLVEELCHLGWEPYAITEMAGTGGRCRVHYFRLAVENRP